MGKPTGFLEHERQNPDARPVEERVQDYGEFLVQLPTESLREQGARCMDCGVPFCHAGCPLGNLIPEWNDLVYRDDWRRAAEFLHATNNFPEFTGRTCPAPCEESCVLAITEPAVTIKNIENAIVERAFAEGWVEPKLPRHRNGKRIAIVGSGPAGLACAEQLNGVGYTVTVFERSDRIGGLLYYGIPDFKLEKSAVERRVDVLRWAGIEFQTGVEVGVTRTIADLQETHDAVVLCVGATRPRELPIPGAELTGVHYAMDFLAQQNRRVAGEEKAYIEDAWWFGELREDILATDKNVIVIGGGDTGSDCVGVSNRQGAKSIVQFQYRPIPEEERPAHQPWPFWPMRLRTSSSHEEGCDRQWSQSSIELLSEDGKVVGVKTVEVEWHGTESGQRGEMRAVEGSEQIWPANLVLLAMGFTGPEMSLLEKLEIDCDERGCAQTNDLYQTNVPGVFACGDMRKGQSLVVWAISEGREAARGVDIALMGASELPSKGPGDLREPS